jgi:hypothetical protein
LGWANASGTKSTSTSLGSLKILKSRSCAPAGYRRVNLRVFPYYVAYIVRDPTIWVLSIAHGHSLPEYWIDRTL